MAITFPLNPVNGVTHIENGITFEYDSTSGSWKKQISIGTLEASTSTFSVTSAVTEEFNRTLGSGASTDLTLSNDHNDKALVHAKKFIPGSDVTDINWDFDTGDESQWNYLSDKIDFFAGKVRLKPSGDAVSQMYSWGRATYYLTESGKFFGTGNPSNNGYRDALDGSSALTTFTELAHSGNVTHFIPSPGSGWGWFILRLSDGTMYGGGRNFNEIFSNAGPT